jgi:dienelactone hydrolase
MAARTCCPTSVKPVVSGYAKKSLEYYLTGFGNKKCILLTPDIFGRHPNSFQLADILASKGFLVVMPDYFKDEPWSTERFPPKEEDNADFGKFLDRIAYDKVKPDVVQAIEVAKSLGAESVGMLGLCWGGKIAMRANADGLIKASATAHPSFVDEQDAKDATVPACVLPSSDEPPMEDIKAALEAKDFAAKNVFKRYDTLRHGFMGARGFVYTDYADETQAAKVNEAIDDVVTFFNNTL